MTARLVLALPVMALGLAGAGCTTPGRPDPELTQQQVCLSHFENDPVLRSKCTLDASLQHDSPPDVQPLDLPVRTGEISD